MTSRSGTSLLRFLPVALAATALAGCSLLFTRPTVRIAEVSLASMGLSGATAQVVLSVENPNGFALRGRELRYVLDFQAEPDTGAQGSWRNLARGTWPDEVEVPPHDSARVSLEVPFRYQDLGAALGALLREGRLRYRVHGDVRFSGSMVTRRVPFDARGTLEP